MGTGDIVGILESQCDQKDWIVVRARLAIRPHLKGDQETTVQVPSKKHVEAFSVALGLEGFQCGAFGESGIRAVHPRTNKKFFVYAKGDRAVGLHPTIRWDSTV